jgi:hypothetical protein
MLKQNYSMAERGNLRKRKKCRNKVKHSVKEKEKENIV